MNGPTVKVRRPAAAGRFYPADPAQLRREVSSMCAQAVSDARAQPPALPQPDAPKALIAPHAGYMYSGEIAASAFATLAGRASGIHRVVVIGPAHFVDVDGLALSPADTFETPLGAVAVDHTLDDALLEKGHGAFRADAHAPEHAIETELPFLQVMLGEFALVPLLVGDATMEEVRDALEIVWGGPETLLVVSSDLSHYLSWADARERDASTARAIEQLEPGSILSDGACGRLAIAGLLLGAKVRGMKATSVDLRNSGDTAGPRDRVVGYGAFAFY